MYIYGNQEDFDKKYNECNDMKLNEYKENIKLTEIIGNKSKIITKTIKIDEDENILLRMHEPLIYSRLGKECETIIKLEEMYSWKNNQNKKVVKLILEKCDSSLHECIKDRKKKNNNFSEKELVKLFVQLVSGYLYMLERKVSHKDIKPGNILIKNGNYKIADFDSAAVNDNVLFKLNFIFQFINKNIFRIF